MSNRRSLEALQWRRLYKLARWQRIRRWVLASEPLCQRCKAEGRIVPATDVHHNPPHEGDLDRFWYGPFEALCKPCHDGPVGKAERSGRDYDTAIGAGGWPTDPRHPANRAAHKADDPHPAWLQPSRIPVQPVASDTRVEKLCGLTPPAALE